MSEQPKKPRAVSAICIMGGAYLLYTAFQMFRLLGAGEADSPLLCAVGGAVLGVSGAALLLIQWRTYRRMKKDSKEPQNSEEDQP